MYFLMVDRFYNGNPKNDRPTPDKSIHPKANYYGGDLSGVAQKTEQGFFEDLHVNTIWLSPITQNPEDAWGYWDKGKTKSKF
ncbi:MAG: alpha-amylase family glycosyl hydrolase, partial [Owenweeksia sp.]